MQRNATGGTLLRFCVVLYSIKHMKKYLAAGAVVIALVLYIVFSGGSNNTAVTPTQNQTTPPPPAAPPSATPSGEPPSSTPPPSAAAGYKDGTFTGKVSNVIFGDMQVQVTIAGGKITDVQFLKYPNSPGHTSRVSAMALPILKQEAIQAQSANVDVVSGATQDTQSFQESLSDALNQAKA